MNARRATRMHTRCFANSIAIGARVSKARSQNGRVEVKSLWLSDAVFTVPQTFLYVAIDLPVAPKPRFIDRDSVRENHKFEWLSDHRKYDRSGAEMEQPLTHHTHTQGDVCPCG